MFLIDKVAHIVIQHKEVHTWSKMRIELKCCHQNVLYKGLYTLLEKLMHFPKQFLLPDSVIVHCGAVVPHSTYVPGSNPGVFQSRVCMFSLCLFGFSPKSQVNCELYVNMSVSGCLSLYVGPVMRFPRLHCLLLNVSWDWHQPSHDPQRI